jgi:hypothetical protein
MQDMTCLLDASTADLWLPSKRCATCAADKEEADTFFFATNSSTFFPQSVLTPFGPAPKALRILYGGGSVAGFVVNDTVKFGGNTFKDQAFLLAEEGSLDTRRLRSYDGVCGIGIKSPEHGGAPLYARLPSRGQHSMYALVPNIFSDDLQWHLKVGSIPHELLEPGSLVWTPANYHPPGAGSEGWQQSGPLGRPPSQGTYTKEEVEKAPVWTVFLGIDGGLQRGERKALALFETGTSFILVPAHEYLPLMRTLIPGFDSYCGFDAKAGNTVVCDCKVRRLVGSSELVLTVWSEQEPVKFSLPLEELLEDIHGAQCVPQIQQRPHSLFGLASPYGILGSPAGIGLSEMTKHKTALSPPPMANGRDPLVKNLLNPLKKLLGNRHAMLKEVVVETLGDGTRCETDLLRASNGSVVNMTTWATDPHGVKKLSTGPTCAATRHAPGMPGQPTVASLLGGRGGPFGPPRGHGSRRLEAKEWSADLWVIGTAFLRKYALILDFERHRIGFATPANDDRPAAAPAPAPGQPSQVASIDAFQGPDADADAIQRFETSRGAQERAPTSPPQPAVAGSARSGAPPLHAGAARTQTSVGHSVGFFVGSAAGVVLAAIVGLALYGLGTSRRHRGPGQEAAFADTEEARSSLTEASSTGGADADAVE